MQFNKIYIEITNRCNLKCSFCSQSNRDKKDMSVEEFQHILNEVSNFTNSIYLHVKGEPLLHPYLDDILTLCDRKQLRVNITTNGTLIKTYFTILLAHSCIKKINFSLHCENDLPHYFTDIFSCGDELSKQMTIVYRLWTLKNHQLDQISLQIVNRIVSYYQLDERTQKSLYVNNNVKVASNIYVDKDNEFIWPSLKNEKQKETGFCYALKTHLAILANGDVVPCCLDGEGIIKLGNLHTQELCEILVSERCTQLKKSFQDRKPCESLCQKCGFDQRMK